MCRIFLSDLDRALQVLRQSDRARPSESLKNIQGKQRLLQTGADNHDIPGGVIESVHGLGVRLKKRLLGWSGSREVLARFADVMHRSTKLCEPVLESSLIARAKDLGLSTPCPQCVGSFIGAEMCAKEGPRPVSTALDFT
jgi:hypothetical protein